MKSERLEVPSIGIRFFSKQEQEAADAVWQGLNELRWRIDEFERAVELSQHCRANILKAHTERQAMRPPAWPSREQEEWERRWTAWKAIAGRDAALCIWNFAHAFGGLRANVHQIVGAYSSPMISMDDSRGFTIDYSLGSEFTYTWKDKPLQLDASEATVDKLIAIAETVSRAFPPPRYPPSAGVGLR